MPLFSNSTGIQFIGGNFYEVAGDIRFHHNPTRGAQGDREMFLDLPQSNSQHSHLRHASAASPPHDLGVVSDGQSFLGSRAPYRHDQVPEAGHGQLQIIEDGTFITAQNYIQENGKTSLQILYGAIAGDAFYNSAERYPMPRCHPETRKKILKYIWSWSTQNDPRTSILWLWGPAGAGKSAISQTFCQQLSDEGRLGASFFFKRGNPSRGNARKLVATIAYQLARLFPEVKDLVLKIISEDPSILDQSLATQLQALIFGPCLAKTNKGELVVVVIDGLDECDGNEVQKELLRSIGNSFHGQVTPLRILIASRPEPHIRKTFEAPSFQVICQKINTEKAFADVRRYLNDEFRRIHQQHRETMENVPTPWPTFDVVEKLVEKSSGYFIYAATIIKLIDDEDFRPTDRLARIMHWQSIIPSQAEDDLPFQALDQLYTQILCCVPPRSRSRLVDILCAVVHFGSLSVASIEILLELQPGDVALTLRRVQSLLLVPSDTTQRITIYHASFMDFLGDAARSGEFCVSDTQRRMNLAQSVLKALSCDSEPDSYLAWKLGSKGLNYVISLNPSEDLSPLIQSINPEFFWRSKYFVKMIEWLKKIQPLPESTIQVWEDFRLLCTCDQVFSSLQAADQAERTIGPGDVHDYYILSHYPQLVRTLQVWCLYSDPYLFGSVIPTVSRLRVLLNMSWDETRFIFRPLQLYTSTERHTKVKILFDLVSRFETISGESYPWPTVCLDVARRLVRQQKLTLVRTSLDPAADRPKEIALAQFIRYCPPSSELLSDLRDMLSLMQSTLRELILYVMHPVVQWLKTFPEPPEEDIASWELYMHANRSHRVGVSFSNGTRTWQQWQVEDFWTQRHRQLVARHQQRQTPGAHLRLEADR